MELQFPLNRHLWVGLLSVALGAFVYWEASGWGRSTEEAGGLLRDSTFPVLLGVGLLITGVLLLFRARKVTPDPSGLRLLGPTALTLALILGFFLLVPHAGFFLTGFLFVLCMLLLLRGTVWWKAILLAAVMVVVIRAIFNLLLKVQFPTGSLFG